jgi:mono/diheme cytochrome c family protein
MDLTSKLRTTLGSIGIVLAGVGSLQAVGLQDLVPSHNPSYRAVLDQYCVTCHNERARTAELLLDQANVEQISEEPETWEKVVKKLRTGAMPPAGMPRPDQATYDSFATYLETTLDRAAAAHPNPGRPVLHRTLSFPRMTPDTALTTSGRF